MASSAPHDCLTDHEANTRTGVPDTRAAGSPEWRLCASRSYATFSREESGGSSVGNEEEHVASEPADGSD